MLKILLFSGVHEIICQIKFRSADRKIVKSEDRIIICRLTNYLQTEELSADRRSIWFADGGSTCRLKNYLQDEELSNTFIIWTRYLCLGLNLVELCDCRKLKPFLKFRLRVLYGIEYIYKKQFSNLLKVSVPS